MYIFFSSFLFQKQAPLLYKSYVFSGHCALKGKKGKEDMLAEIL